ncbi:MAG: rhomboid family intramembrane serine protease [Bacteroidales bacterium]|nr:rhomboid family intramembrane serine protease [Bacteroidales bacterium]
MNIRTDIMQEFKRGDYLTKLILINGALFLLLWLIEILASIINPSIYSAIIANISAPTQGSILLHKPWTILTYMFFDTSFLSLLCNMLFLFWMGRLFIDLVNEKQLLATYILGGFAGVALPLICSSATTIMGMLLNPIAAVLAVTAAIATYAPNYRVYLLFFGEVKLKTLAIIIVVVELLPLLSISSQVFQSQVLAVSLCKLGGILYGCLWALLYKKGTDINEWFIRLVTRIEKRETKTSRIHVTKRNKRDESYVDYEDVTSDTNQAEIDKILKKIAESGYNSLSNEEKENLFRHNNK